MFSVVRWVNQARGVCHLPQITQQDELLVIQSLVTTALCFPLLHLQFVLQVISSLNPTASAAVLELSPLKISKYYCFLDLLEGRPQDTRIWELKFVTQYGHGVCA